MGIFRKNFKDKIWSKPFNYVEKETLYKLKLIFRML